MAARQSDGQAERHPREASTGIRRRDSLMTPLLLIAIGGPARRGGDHRHLVHGALLKSVGAIKDDRALGTVQGRISGMDTAGQRAYGAGRGMGRRVDTRSLRLQRLQTPERAPTSGRAVIGPAWASTGGDPGLPQGPAGVGDHCVLGHRPRTLPAITTSTSLASITCRGRATTWSSRAITAHNTSISDDYLNCALLHG